MQQEVLAVSVPEAGRMCGISRTQSYKMVKEGKLPVVRLGGRLVVPKKALEKMLDNAGGGIDGGV